MPVPLCGASKLANDCHTEILKNVCYYIDGKKTNRVGLPGNMGLTFSWLEHQGMP